PPRRPPISTLFPYTTLFRSNDPPPPQKALLCSLQSGSKPHLPDIPFVVPGVQIPPDNGAKYRLVNAQNSHRIIGFRTSSRKELSDRKSTRLNSSHVKISYAV